MNKIVEIVSEQIKQKKYGNLMLIFAIIVSMLIPGYLLIAYYYPSFLINADYLKLITTSTIIGFIIFIDDFIIFMIGYFADISSQESLNINIEINDVGKVNDDDPKSKTSKAYISNIIKDVTISCTITSLTFIILSPLIFFFIIRLSVQSLSLSYFLFIQIINTSNLIMRIRSKTELKSKKNLVKNKVVLVFHIILIVITSIYLLSIFLQ